MDYHRNLKDLDFPSINEFTHDMLSRFCNIDYDREIAIVAEYSGGNKRRMVGVSRLIIDASKEFGEFATVIADEFRISGWGINSPIC